jgi:hypothetical protein
MHLRGRPYRITPRQHTHKLKEVTARQHYRQWRGILMYWIALYHLVEGVEEGDNTLVVIPLGFITLG